MDRKRATLGCRVRRLAVSELRQLRRRSALTADARKLHPSPRRPAPPRDRSHASAGSVSSTLSGTAFTVAAYEFAARDPAPERRPALPDASSGSSSSPLTRPRILNAARRDAPDLHHPARFQPIAPRDPQGPRNGDHHDLSPPPRPAPHVRSPCAPAHRRSGASPAPAAPARSARCSRHSRGAAGQDPSPRGAAR